LRDLLRGLADVSRTVHPRYDQLLVQVPRVRKRLLALFAAAVAEDAGSRKRVAAFLNAWPSALYLPEVSGWLSLSVIDIETKPVVALAAAVRRSSRRMLRETALDVARRMLAARTEFELTGRAWTVEDLAAAAYGKSVAQKNKRDFQRIWQKFREHPRLERFRLEIDDECKLHSGRAGLFPAKKSKPVKNPSIAREGTATAVVRPPPANSRVPSGRRTTSSAPGPSRSRSSRSRRR
jgi:hypothetical protein